MDRNRVRDEDGSRRATDIDRRVPEVIFDEGRERRTEIGLDVEALLGIDELLGGSFVADVLEQSRHALERVRAGDELLRTRLFIHVGEIDEQCEETPIVSVAVKALHSIAGRARRRKGPPGIERVERRYTAERCLDEINDRRTVEEVDQMRCAEQLVGGVARERGVPLDLGKRPETVVGAQDM